MVFLKAWRGHARLQVHHESALPCLYGIATNVCRNQRRSLRRYRAATARLPLEDRTDVRARDHADDVAGRIDDERQMDRIRREVGRLSAGERDVVALVVWEGLDYASAASALGIPVGTVRSRLSRARARLSASLATPHIQQQP